ncbi:hypothetical protein BD413DRAFT_609526 [Trametes elegans]|nr:hypothetical protein BD413DRAFT_609526 [Trametes elegans]
MMFIQSFVAFSFFVLGAQAAPAKRDADVAVPGVGTIKLPGIDDGSNVSPEQAISILQANSQALSNTTALGTATFMQAEAAFVMEQVATAIPATETQLSYFIVNVATTPVVQVSSIGGSAITLATGTAEGTLTSFAGHTFTAAPATNNAASDLRVPTALVSGAATILIILGSIALGAVALL